MSKPSTPQIAAIKALDEGLTIVEVTNLTTLPHSAVARISLDNNKSAIFKQAGNRAFTDKIRKELLINHNLVSRLAHKVAPTLLASDATTDQPWMLFEDLADGFGPSPFATAPPYRYIAMFVRALAKIHAQASTLDLKQAFADIPGDVHITDGSEYVPGMLDEFLSDCDPERFTPKTYQLLRKLRDNIPQLIELLSGRSTLVHGDAHFGNALYADEAMLLDWALATIGPGEVDLSHALGMNLPRHFANEYEIEAIREYVKTSDDCGLHQSEADVLERYRQCLLLTVVVSVGMKSVPGVNDRVWEFLFINAMHSAVEHDALSFLG